MAQSNSQDSGLISILSNLFVDKPKPPPQPASQSGLATRRQDELVKKFPGSKIVRRPYNRNSTLFPSSSCDYYMESFYEYVRDSKMDYKSRTLKDTVRRNCGIEV
uniref:uncharacterized protein LOC105353094 n=1 Tax=Fragaria vesca subsp. vesca TaxID=101020 RepID=UPI0005C9B60E|nr:PREDICTED: uncharacterized protein LOC105353094 [Fragaria vesca subsp. vesca]